VGVAIDSIEVGKCYVTAIGQIRRVLETGSGRVKYEARGKTTEDGSWSSRTTSSGRFANDVEREVPCDYDPN
jgi:hypothetical protein